MAFEDYTTFIEPIKIPIHGKEYTLPMVGAKLGVRITIVAEQAKRRLQIQMSNDQAAAEAEEVGLPAPEPEPLPEYTMKDATAKELLGDVYEEMVEDDIPLILVELAAQTAYHDFLFGRAAAEAFWNSGGDPKATAEALPALNLFTTSGVEESTTPIPDSTSGTKSKTKSSQNTTDATKSSRTSASSKTGGSSKPRSKPSTESTSKKSSTTNHGDGSQPA